MPKPARSSPAPKTPNRNALAIAVCAVLLLIFYFASWFATFTKSPIYDEPLHLVSSWVLTQRDDFRTNPEDPVLWKYWAAAGMDQNDLKLYDQSPLWKLMLQAGSQFSFASLTLYKSGADVSALFRSAHARMAVLGVLLGIFIAWWAWRLAGPVAAVVATAAFAFDPNFLGHASLVKNDVPMTLVFIAFMATLWLVGQKATPLRLVSLALLTGAALTTKFSGILTLPILALALLIRCLLPDPWPILHLTAKTRAHRLAAAAAITVSSALVGFLLIWTCYGFRFSPGKTPDQIFNAQILADSVARLKAIQTHDSPMGASPEQIEQWTSQQKPGLANDLFLWANDHHLFPQAWLYGFYYTWGRSLFRASYLLGNYSNTGWWYYFPAAIAFKTPLATLLALAAAIILWLTLRSQKIAPAKPLNLWSTISFLILPVLYSLLAITGDLNLGLRHSFPIYPFIFIFIGVMSARALSLRPKITRPIFAILLVALFAETLSAYPDMISFFNVAAGGSRGGLHLLGDSNLDWGQDLPALAAWQKRNPNCQIYFSYFGYADPRYYGLHYVNVTDSQAPDDEKPDPALPPVLAVSATNLQGIYLTPEQRAYYAALQQQNPIAILGGSIYIYDHVAGHLPPLRQSGAPSRASPSSPGI